MNTANVASCSLGTGSSTGGTESIRTESREHRAQRGAVGLGFLLVFLLLIKNGLAGAPFALGLGVSESVCVARMRVYVEYDILIIKHTLGTSGDRGGRPSSLCATH
jgi:hypothetical protein